MTGGATLAVGLETGPGEVQDGSTFNRLALMVSKKRL